MRKIWAVAKREFKSYFITPTGYVVAGAYAAITGVGFAASFIVHARTTLRPSMHGLEGVPDLEETFLSPFLVFCGQLLLLMGPLITMRLLAEERSRGTLELLLTYPLRDRDIIFGKFVAALGMVLVLMLIVGAHLTIMFHFTTVEPAVLWFGLFGVFLMSAVIISIGMFVSAVTRNQITAAVVTFAALFISYVLGTFGESLPEQVAMPPSLPETIEPAFNAGYSLVRQVVVELPLDSHVQEMAIGIAQVSDIVYYLVFTAFFLFLTFRALESRRWRA